MNKSNLFMAIVPQGADQEFLHQVARSLGYTLADIVIGTLRNAVATFASRTEAPRYILLDIGEQGHEILPEIDYLAEHCEAGTRVIVMGKVNDVTFYRALRARGVLEYFTPPAKVSDIQAAFLAGATDDASGGGKVIAFMSAASGDGASTIALNTAYALATECNKSVVLVDMDYQFGMVAKNLDLTATFGIKELFEHPDRGIDSTLVKRMLVPYGQSRLSVIAAPNELRTIPDLRTEVIRELILTLRQEYDVVILDLPHIWNPWVASTLSLATHVNLVAQLWLRSVTHSARLLAAWRSSGITNNRISLLINRSGAKFKEAISTRDFERVCGLPIKHYFINDIRSTVTAENHGKTILEGGNSVIAKQLKEFAVSLDKEQSVT
jgi:pilus assembly protein CpaE